MIILILGHSMGERYYRSGKLSGFQFDSRNDSELGRPATGEDDKSKKDDDLVIEENTVYEIDRECYERIKKQRKK
jgi:hypothetical protein